ncbi:MAG: T9SS type A sorting domain-containing protein [Bacteroidia bacterium]
MGYFDARHLNRLLLLACFPVLLGLLGSSAKAQFLYWDYHDMVTDTVQSGAYQDMVIDVNGTIHISYWHRVEDKLIYAYKTAGSNVWLREYVDPVNENGFRSAIALNASGQVHIAYYEDVNSKIQVRYAKRVSPNNWLIENLPDIYGIGYGDYGPLGTVSGGERVQQSLGMVFDENDKPQIAFFDGWMKDGAFPACTPNSEYNFKMHQAIRVNNQWLVRSMGHVHDIHQSCNPYATRDTLPSGDRYGEYLDMLMLPDGTMDIYSMSRFNNELIRHRTLFPFVDTVWVKTPIDSLERIWPTATNGFGQFTRFFTFEGIAAHRGVDGNTHLSYTTSIFYGDNFCCVDSLTLAYARVTPAGATTYSTISRGTYTNYTDVRSHNGSDSLYVLYADLSNLAFVLASSTNGGSSWSGDTIMTGIAISRMCLEIKNDTLYGLVFDGQRERLVLCKRHVQGGPWVFDEVTHSQSRGQSMDASIYIVGNDTVAQVAFNDGYTGKLYHSTGWRSTGWNWNIEELDPTNYDAIAVSQAHTNANESMIAYNGGVGRDLRLATHTPGGWQYEIIEPGGNPQFTDLAVSSLDTVHLVYYDGVYNCLHHKWRHLNQIGWYTEDIDCDTTAIGLFPSMVLDAAGLPHVAYYSDLDRSLYYARLNGTTRQWEIDSVAGGTSSAIGKYASLVLDANGLPKIAYLNEQDDAVLLSEKAQNGTWTQIKVDSLPISNIGRPIDMKLDMFGNVWVAYNFFSNFERTKLMHRDSSGWHQVGVSSQGRIANEFNFEIIGGDLFIVGKKNEIQNTGVAMIHARNGVFVEAAAPNLLSYTVNMTNIPNPFSDNTTFQLKIEKPDVLTLEIRDMVGQHVSTLFEGRRLETGVHEFEWDASAMPAGVYFYELRSATGRMIQKMVHVR